MKVKIEYKYILTFVSVCECGIDIHSYPFNKKKDAQIAMREQYLLDKQEIDKSVRKASISRNGYEVYEEGRYIENSLTAKITKEEVR